jgi:hypothetical protein
MIKKIQIPEHSPPLPTQLTMIANQPSTLPSIHANNITLKVSAVDLAIIFGHEEPPIALAYLNAPVTGASIRPDVLVNMPWPTAKILCEFLVGIIKEYEAIAGPVKIPKQGRPTEEQFKSLVARIREQGLVE